MANDFYRAFEDKFRGSRELILSRLTVYLPFIRPLKEFSNQPRAVDLGCGRGEWLELVEREGFDATGVDLDEGMLKACQSLNLKTHKAEALGFLESLPDGSVGVITGFHIIEHIPFEALQKLIKEALRVLAPGGLLIMETPNPENIQVASHTFYYDPTHQRPIPPLLLAFLPEHYGFCRTKILRLQQDPKLEISGSANLMDVLAGTSPDYSVVAQKLAKAHHLVKFDLAFQTDHGLTLHTLATRYDTRIEASVHQAQQAITMADNALGTAQQAVAVANKTQELITRFEATLEHHRRLTTATEKHITDLLQSTSWRATAPLRWASRVLRATLRVVLLPVMRFVARRSWLRKPLSSLLKLFPPIAHRLHLIAIHRGLIPAPLDAFPATPEKPVTAPCSAALPPATTVTTLRLDGDPGAGGTWARSPLEKTLTAFPPAP